MRVLQLFSALWFLRGKHGNCPIVVKDPNGVIYTSMVARYDTNAQRVEIQLKGG